MAERSVKEPPLVLALLSSARHRLNVFSMLLIMVLTLGCTKATPEIVGSWDNVKAPEVAEFKPDGTGVFTYPGSRNPPLSFAWKQVVKNSYVLDVNFMGSRKNLTATVRGTSLGIESTTGVEMYQRHASR